MGRFISAYLVDLDQVKGAIGSRDDKLRRMIEDRYRVEFARDDEGEAEYIEDGAPTKAETIRALLDGGPFTENWEHFYARSYEKLCEFHSHWRSGHGPYHGDWLSEVDSRLEQLGVSAIGFKRFERSYPAGVPRNYDGGYGEWAHDDCVKATAQFAATTEKQRLELEDDMWIGTAMKWAAVAAHSPGLGIAGFFTI